MSLSTGGKSPESDTRTHGEPKSLPRRIVLAIVRFSVERPMVVIGVHLAVALLFVSMFAARFVEHMGPMMEARASPEFGVTPPSDEDLLDHALLLAFNDGMSNTLGTESPAIKSYLQMQQDYPEDEVILVMLRGPEGLALSEQPGIVSALPERLLGLRDVARIHWAGTLAGAPAELMAGQPLPPEEASRFVSRLGEDPTAHSVFRTEEGPTWLIYVFLDDGLGDLDLRRLRLDREIRAQVDQFVAERSEVPCASCEGPWTGVSLGVPSTLGYMLLTIVRGVIVNFTIVNLVVTALCLFFLRHTRGVLLAMLALLQSQVLTILPFFLLGRTFDWVNSNLATTALLMGVAGSIHCLHAYLEARASGLDASAAVLSAFEHILGPYAFAVVTSMVAFLALESTSSIPSVVEYGLFSTLGLGLCFVTDLSLLCALLARFDKPAPRHYPREILNTLALRVSAASYRNAKLTLSLWGAVMLLGIIGTWKLVAEERINSNIIEYFRRSTVISQTEKVLRGSGIGTLTQYVEMTLPEGQSWTSPASLRRLDQLSTDMMKSDAFPPSMQVRSIDSVAQMARSACLAFEDMACADGWPPDERLAEAIERTPASAMLIPHQLNVPGDTQRLLIMTDSFYSREGPRFRNTALSILHDHFPELGLPLDLDGDGLTDVLGSDAGMTPGARIRSMGSVWSEMENKMIRELLQGFALALVPIIVMLIVVFRRPKLIALSVLPNIPPIPIAFGVFGLLGIYIPSPALFAMSIAAGVIVDDTMFFVGHVDQHAREGLSTEEGLRKTIIGAGVPILVTNVVLAVGFLTLVTAELIPLAKMGALLAMILLVGLISDLTLIPGLLGLRPDKDKP